MPELMTEIVSGEPYQYCSLGDYVVRAVGVCGGRPTFKYTRIEITGTLERLAAGEHIEDIVQGYRGRVSRAAIMEAVRLVTEQFLEDAARSRAGWMIVLDEQLLGRGLERDIAQWYRGTVQFITDLRPHTIIKDEAIPVLLRRAGPTDLCDHQRARL